MPPRSMVEETARAIEAFRVVLRNDPMVWLSALWASLLIVVVIGVVLVTRHQRQREQRATGGTVSEWGERLAVAYELRRKIKRLSEENQRLCEERTELVKVFGRAVEVLQQEVGQISGKSTSTLVSPISDGDEPRADGAVAPIAAPSPVEPPVPPNSPCPPFSPGPPRLRPRHLRGRNARLGRPGSQP